jgi:hypothetical protein
VLLKRIVSLRVVADASRLFAIVSIRRRPKVGKIVADASRRCAIVSIRHRPKVGKTHGGQFAAAGLLTGEVNEVGIARFGQFQSKGILPFRLDAGGGLGRVTLPSRLGLSRIRECILWNGDGIRSVCRLFFPLRN